VEAGVKLRGAEKVARIPVKIIPTDELPKKPDWIRVRIPVSPEVDRIKQLLRKHKLHSVCEEASCPNLGECFSGGTATFMIMGDICTRRCPFCDVGHGRPKPLDVDEPKNLAIAIADLRLKYVVITSVDRDDLRDGGAQHFADCIREIRALSPGVQLETLVPDYRGRMDVALEITAQSRRMCSTTTSKPCRACTRPRARVRTTSGRWTCCRSSSRWCRTYRPSPA
jgi:lipoic acid synthetase